MRTRPLPLGRIFSTAVKYRKPDLRYESVRAELVDQPDCSLPGDLESRTRIRTITRMETAGRARRWARRQQGGILQRGQDRTTAASAKSIVVRRSFAKTVLPLAFGWSPTPGTLPIGGRGWPRPANLWSSYHDA